MNMESIEKLRKFMDCQFRSGKPIWTDGMDIADAIEREIAEKYMELPVDADGVPIHVGDYLQLGNMRSKVVALRYRPANGELPWEWQCDTGDWYNTAFAHHVKPRTLRDILFDFMRDCETSELGNSELVEKYEVELRELLGGEHR